MEWNIEKTILFIEDYRHSPELWNFKSIVYKDTRLKQDTLNWLSDKYNCSVLNVKNKIKNLRSAFHRERKKVEKFKKSGLAQWKKGSWFAYEPLSFLLDAEVSKSTTSDREDSTEEEDLLPDTTPSTTKDTQNTTTTSESRAQHSKSREFSGSKRSSTLERNKEHLVSNKKPRRDEEEEDAYGSNINTSNLQHVRRQRDEFSTYGEHVANELRNLKPRAQTVVKHLVNNILFNAAMGKYDDENVSISSTTHAPCTTYDSNFGSQFFESGSVLQSSITVASEDVDYEKVVGTSADNIHQKQSATFEASSDFLKMEEPYQ